MKTTALIGNSGIKTERLASLGSEELADMADACVIQGAESIGRESSGCSRDRAAPVVFLRKRRGCDRSPFISGRRPNPGIRDLDSNRQSFGLITARKRTLPSATRSKALLISFRE